MTVEKAETVVGGPGLVETEGVTDLRGIAAATSPGVSTA